MCMSINSDNATDCQSIQLHWLCKHFRQWVSYSCTNKENPIVWIIPSLKEEKSHLSHYDTSWHYIDILSAWYADIRHFHMATYYYMACQIYDTYQNKRQRDQWHICLNYKSTTVSKIDHCICKEEIGVQMYNLGKYLNFITERTETK